MQVTTTKQLMDRSKVFRLLFWGSIVCVSAGLILSIVYPFTSCYTVSKRSCSWNYGSSYPFECQSYNVVFCCSYGFSSCGSNSYCRIKPSYYFPCDGVIIAAWSLLGTGLFQAIFVFVLFCKYRQQVREGQYLNFPQSNNPFINQYASPVLVYSDPSNGQVEAPMTKHQINIS